MIVRLMDRIFSGVFRGMEKKNPRPHVHRRDDVSRILNKEYRSGDGALLSIDIYMPKEHDRANKLPVVIAVHGGGFFVGSKGYYDQAGEDLASRGYLVFALDYRLIPKVRVYGIINDTISGFNHVEEHLEEYGGDPDRVYVIAESAGAYLATYTYALKTSEGLRSVLSSQPYGLKIRAMNLLFGMFYTNSFLMSITMGLSMYGTGKKARLMKPYRNPERSDIIGSFPPVLLLSSRADFLKKDSLRFGNVLTESGIENRFEDLGEDDRLTHAFTVMHPDYPESSRALELADRWFREH